MHELGVVFHMVDLLEDVGREQGLTRVSEVVVDLGEVSGVVTELFEDAWEWASNRHDSHSWRARGSFCTPHRLNKQSPRAYPICGVRLRPVSRANGTSSEALERGAAGFFFCSYFPPRNDGRGLL